MTKSLVGVIYDKKTLAVRRIVLPDADHQLSLHVGKGEALATGPRHEGHSLKQACAIVRRKTGREPTI